MRRPMRRLVSPWNLQRVSIDIYLKHPFWDWTSFKRLLAKNDHLGDGDSIFLLIYHPYVWGRLSNTFQMGWNHHLVTWRVGKKHSGYQSWWALNALLWGWGGGGVGWGCNSILGTCTAGRRYTMLTLLEVGHMVNAMQHTCVGWVGVGRVSCVSKCKNWGYNMGVSENSGTPKSSHFNIF